MASTSFDQLISSDTAVLIDFYATWCGPCKAFMPTLKEVKAKLGDNVRIVKVDIDKNEDLASQLGIRSVPTVHIYRQGELRWSAVGGQSQQVLIDQIQSASS